MNDTTHSVTMPAINPYISIPYSIPPPPPLPPPEKTHWFRIIVITSLVWILIGIMAGIVMYTQTTAHQSIPGVVHITKTDVLTKIVKVYITPSASTGYSDEYKAGYQRGFTDGQNSGINQGREIQDTYLANWSHQNCYVNELGYYETQWVQISGGRWRQRCIAPQSRLH